MSTIEEKLTQLARNAVKVMQNRVIVTDWELGPVDVNGKRPEGGYQITYRAETSVKLSSSFDSALWLVFESLGADKVSLEATCADDVLSSNAMYPLTRRDFAEYKGVYADRYRLIFANTKAREEAQRAGTKYVPIKAYRYVSMFKTLYPAFYEKLVREHIKVVGDATKVLEVPLNHEVEEMLKVCVDAIEHENLLKPSWVEQLCEFDITLTEKRVSTGICRTLITSAGASTQIPNTYTHSSDTATCTGVTTSRIGTYSNANTLVWTSNTTSITKK